MECVLREARAAVSGITDNEISTEAYYHDGGRHGDSYELAEDLLIHHRGEKPVEALIDDLGLDSKDPNVQKLLDAYGYEIKPMPDAKPVDVELTEYPPVPTTSPVTKEPNTCSIPMV